MQQAAQVVERAEGFLLRVDAARDLQGVELELLGALQVAHVLVRDARAIERPAEQRRVARRAGRLQRLRHVGQRVAVQAHVVVGHCQGAQHLRALAGVALALEQRQRAQAVVDRCLRLAEAPLVQCQQVQRAGLQALVIGAARRVERAGGHLGTAAMVTGPTRVVRRGQRGAGLCQQGLTGTACGHERSEDAAV